MIRAGQRRRLSAAVRPLKTAGLVSVVLALAGCSLFGGGANLHTPAPLPDISHQKMHFHTVWSTSVGSGSDGYVTGLRLAIDGRRVYGAGRDGSITAVQLDNGKRVWRKTLEPDLLAGPAVADGTLVVATVGGKVIALSADDGSKLWDFSAGSEVLAAPAIGDGSVVVRTEDGRLIALNMKTGKQRWSIQRSVPTLTMRGTSRPVIDRGVVLAGMDNGKVIAVDLDNGKVLWSQRVAEPTGASDLERMVDVDAPLLLAGSQVYAASIGKQLVSISRSSGLVIWTQSVASRTGMAFSGDQLFISGVDGTVRDVNRQNGALVWKQDKLTYRRLSKPVMYLGYVVVGDYQGYLHFLVPEDGTIVARARPVGDAIEAAPVVVGRRILVLSSSGDLVALEPSDDS